MRGREKDENAVDEHGNDANEHMNCTDEHGREIDRYELDGIEIQPWVEEA